MCVSAAFDQEHLKLYVTISQLFSIFIIPFYRVPVTLTTVLTLTTDPTEYRGYLHFSDNYNSNDRSNTGDDTLITNGDNNKHYYWISSQENLYQTTELVKFFLPFGIGVFLVFVWHLFATAGCVLGSLLLSPVTWAEERLALTKESREVVGNNMKDLAGNVAEQLTREAGSVLDRVSESVEEPLKDI